MYVCMILLAHAEQRVLCEEVAVRNWKRMLVLDQIVELKLGGVVLLLAERNVCAELMREEEELPVEAASV